MSAKIEQTYYELSEHNFAQIIIFFLLVALCLFGIFFFTFPLIEYFFKTFLQSGIYNTTGTSVSYKIDDPMPMMQVEYLTAWAIDIYKGTPEESRYWFNPLLSLIFQFSILSLGVATIVTAVLPSQLGYIRQKIEREIANSISKIAFHRYGMHSKEESHEIVNEIITADLQDLHTYADDWSIALDDLITLQRAIKWRSYNFLKRLVYFNYGIQMYMRFYFTSKYSNTVLGLVYMGAAVLIIIIGLRGLKFIPPTQPSLVLFALGLEFSLLITYAITLMYTKQDESEQETHSKGNSGGDALLLSNDFGSSKDIEKLLRVFVKSNSKKKK